MSPRFSPSPSKSSGAQLSSNNPATGGAQFTCTAPVYKCFMAFNEKAAADPEAASELAINTFEEVAGEHDTIKIMPTAVPGTGLTIYKRLGGEVHPFGEALGSELEYRLKFLDASFDIFNGAFVVVERGALVVPALLELMSMATAHDKVAANDADKVGELECSFVINGSTYINMQPKRGPPTNVDMEESSVVGIGVKNKQVVKELIEWASLNEPFSKMSLIWEYDGKDVVISAHSKNVMKYRDVRRISKVESMANGRLTRTVEAFIPSTRGACTRKDFIGGKGAECVEDSFNGAVLETIASEYDLKGTGITKLMLRIPASHVEFVEYRLRELSKEGERDGTI